MPVTIPITIVINTNDDTVAQPTVTHRVPVDGVVNRVQPGDDVEFTFDVQNNDPSEITLASAEFFPSDPAHAAFIGATLILGNKRISPQTISSIRVEVSTTPATPLNLSISGGLTFTFDRT